MSRAVGCRKNKNTTQIQVNETDSHPWTLQQVSDEFQHWEHLPPPEILIIIRCSCCMPTLSVDILNNNDVINDVVIITKVPRYVKYTVYVTTTAHWTVFTFHFRYKNLAVLEFIERPSYIPKLRKICSSGVH